MAGASIRVINKRSARSRKQNRNGKNRNTRNNNRRSANNRNNNRNIVSDSLKSLFDNVKSALVKIPTEIGTKYTYKVEYEELKKDELPPSKLDVLIFMAGNGEHFKKLPPRAAKMLEQLNEFLGDNKADIDARINLDTIDNNLSIYDRNLVINKGFNPLFMTNDQLIKLTKGKQGSELQALMCEFVSVQMSENIKTLYHHYKITVAEHDSEWESTFHIYNDHEMTDADLTTLINKLLRNILIYRHIFPKLKKIPNLTLYLLKDKKKLPPEKNYNGETLFTANSVNSALTGGETILIFREEELSKVLLHECMHYYFELIGGCSEEIDPDYAIESKAGHKYIETIIETIADIINAIIISDTLDDFKTNLNLEIDFIFKQAGKILKHSGYSNWNEYCNKEDEKIPKIIETTNMHAYFILRTILFFNSQYNQVITQLMSETGITGPNCTAIIQFLKDNKNNSAFVKKINEYINMGITDYNLRMTSLES